MTARVPTRLVAATRKGLYRVERHGESDAWEVAGHALVGENLSNVLFDPRDGSLLVALADGHFGPKLRRSLDGGETWEERPLPVFPPKPADAEDDIDPVRNKPVPWSIVQFWCLETGGDDGELWAGTLPGALFHSRDGGDSWAMVRSLWDHPGRRRWMGGGYDVAGIHSICVDPRDPARVTVGVSVGGVWHTADRGETWELRGEGLRAEYMPPEQAGDPGSQDPHRIVRCATSPDVLWMQHHNGVFRSTDDGRTWSELTMLPSGFGFGVAADPHDPLTAWFAPATKDQCRVPVDGAVVATRTTDGGQSFDVLREGLPQRFAADLIYRHALVVDPSGACLAMASTTGSLWISEDRGDTWRLVTAHLPPVHELRFA